MAKKFTGTKLLIASGNEGKVTEIRELLGDFNVQIVSAADLNLSEPEETGENFIQNAEIKARYYGKATGLPALADDSGLCVDALGGQPGIFSARWAGEKKDFKAAIKRVKEELAGNDNKDANFTCALALYWPQTDEIESFEGKVSGTLTFPPKGTKGFGYDPIFTPRGFGKTFGEMSSLEKHKISHRANAFAKLIEACFN